eukprot:23692-Chlamydomonas_euryale.AAC.4
MQKCRKPTRDDARGGRARPCHVAHCSALGSQPVRGVVKAARMRRALQQKQGRVCFTKQGRTCGM